MSASFSECREADATVLTLAGNLDAEGVAAVWPRLIDAARGARGSRLVLDLAGLRVCDTSGATLIAAADEAHGAPAELRGGTPGAQQLIDTVRRLEITPSPAPKVDMAARSMPIPGIAGIGFVGEIAIATSRLPARRRMLRLGELLLLMEQAGWRALPLCALVGVLLGLIMAFQSSMPLRRYGGEIYVVNLVCAGVLRELGPLVAAIILAGRTGSAYAAELGTMTVNSEIAAMATIGADPVTMLVLPRLVAVLLVMPAMILTLELAALAGMTIVVLGLGYPLAAIAHQIASGHYTGDLLGGAFKGCVFGVAAAAIGCSAGLATGDGPRAVGLSATRAVVGGLVGCMLLDAVFSALYFRLDL